MHHYPFHPGDYLYDTAHLEPLEDLAYRRLLDLYYTSEAPIPSETQQVSRRLRLGSEVLEKVLREFFTETPEGWKHARCDREIARFNGRSEASRTNGKQGGRPKKTQQVSKKTQQVNLANLEKPSSPNQNQNQNHIPPNPQGGNGANGSDFDEFWKAYPKRIGKAAALKAWKRAQRPPLPVILSAIEAQSCTEQWMKDGGQFIPHPATWLNHGRWDDDATGLNGAKDARPRPTMTL